MKGWFKLCLIVYWFALSTWLAALVTAGVSAANVFGRMDELGVRLDAYASVPAGEHGRFAAGQVMADVFLTVDLLQFSAVPLTVITLALQLVFFRLSLRRFSNIVRTAALLIAAGLFAFYAGTIAPEMNRDLRRYWSLAAAGEIEQATVLRASFNEQHETAETILQVNLLLVVAAIAASAMALAPPLPGREEEIEQPALLKER